MDFISIIIVAIICIVIGVLIGLLLSGFASSGKNVDNPGEAVLQVWRKPHTQELLVELEDQQYERGYDLNADLQAKMHTIILDLNAWLTLTTPNQIEAVGTKPETLTSEDTEEKTQPRLRLNPFNVLADALHANVPLSELPPESMVQQIDDLLQQKLEEAALLDKAVRLLEWPGAGMVVMIGLEKFEEIDAVPDENIQTLIRAAVKDWEQQQDVDTHQD